MVGPRRARDRLRRRPGPDEFCARWSSRDRCGCLAHRARPGGAVLCRQRRASLVRAGGRSRTAVSRGLVRSGLLSRRDTVCYRSEGDRVRGPARAAQWRGSDFDGLQPPFMGSARRMPRHAARSRRCAGISGLLAARVRTDAAGVRGVSDPGRAAADRFVASAGIYGMGLQPAVRARIQAAARTAATRRRLALGGLLPEDAVGTTRYVGDRTDDSIGLKRAAGGGALAALRVYRDLVVGSPSWLALLHHEL